MSESFDPPKTQAAGTPAVLSSLKQVFGKAGVVRGTKALLELNQIGGFDCPSCAWPDPDDDRAPAEFCENGAKAIASEAMRHTIGREFFAAHSVTDLLSQSDAWHDLQGRLTEPVLLREGATHYEPVSWQEAFAIIAEELSALASPDEAVFYTSGRASNEAAFLYQLFVRAYGTNNLPDCSNMCHESSGLAMNEAIGVGKGTVTLDDFLEADVILCIGQNPGTNHPRMLSTLEAAVKKGAKIVAVNPLKEAGLIGFAHPQHVSGLLGKSTPLASTYLQVKVNGDMALIRGLAKVLVEKDAVDHDFIRTHSHGFQEYLAVLDTASWPEIEAMSGIPQEEIRSLAETVAARDKRLITCWAMGLTQHRNAVATIREVVNLHVLLGAIGRPGAGLCPVRGHSNVQGDRTMGIFEKMPEAFLATLEQQAGIPIPREHGFDTVESILAMHNGRAKFFFGLGGNFAQATPDSAFTAEALRKCSLTCHVSTKLNRSHLITGKRALILPCLGRSESDSGRFITTENSMGVVQSSEGKLKPASEHLLSETDIIARIAEATLGDCGNIRWRWLAEDYNRLRTWIEAVVPGFENFNDRATLPGGFYLPNSAKERIWKTPTAKANFSSAPLDSYKPSNGRFLLQTLRSHDQFNTTIYGMDDRYRGISGMRDIVFLNPKDMAALGVNPGQRIDLTSHWNDGERHLKGFRAIPYDMPRTMAAAYFPEANVLVPVGHVAEGSNTPASKSIEVSIKPST
ncbi:MAG: FdhF/YdeP family oxidoreductase [Akkermansiaceae bacterium]|nr:FdhF/YdeP family oxidoreductase [Akkermansiaceae bacterium]MDP4647254.1 FdhF/YdeP family oxidoreductase [Akkermansiaceae bacterium]MDP4722520.1 FdhF/YdeP family oxidoreductase [Akkermansiaceae bacterium]MDP4781034.1 FdhF/YdeP family oxidoreductase [Akkermansiaceae bacterium]MDP4848532.1 FdhF/YdeP family oxidoreductase [Akkermansiaceae bacterium]